MDLIIRQARTKDSQSLVDIGIKNGKFHTISKKIMTKAAHEINAKGNLVCPPFIEAHIHLDAALSAPVAHANQSGTLSEAINRWAEYKETITKEEIMHRAERAIHWLIANGVLKIRTHTDCTESTLKTIEAMLELKEKFKPYIDIQIVAFPQDGIYASPNMDTLLEEAIKMGADVVGGLPQQELTREDGIRSIAYVFELANKYDKQIDIHTDETGDPHSRFLEVITKFAIESNNGSRVTASHTTAMHNYENDYAQKVIDQVKRANMHIVTNPFSNALLQNRLDGYPRRRGTTRVDQLLENNVNVTIGSDNLMDPFGPFGKGSLLQAAFLLAHTAHLSGKDDMKSLFQMITDNGAKMLQDENYGIEVGKRADCIVLDAKDEYEALRLSSECLYVIRNGTIVSKTVPASRFVQFGAHTYQVDFKVE